LRGCSGELRLIERGDHVDWPARNCLARPSRCLSARCSRASRLLPIFPRLHSGRREPDMTKLSEADAGEIQKAIKYCKGKSPPYLSRATHFEKSWAKAPANRAMKYENFIDDENPHRKEILVEAREWRVVTFQLGCVLLV
jgi:hypothetical protein